MITSADSNTTTCCSTVVCVQLAAPRRAAPRRAGSRGAFVSQIALSQCDIPSSVINRSYSFFEHR